MASRYTGRITRVSATGGDRFRGRMNEGLDTRREEREESRIISNSS